MDGVKDWQVGQAKNVIHIHYIRGVRESSDLLLSPTSLRTDSGGRLSFAVVYDSLHFISSAHGVNTLKKWSLSCESGV